MGWGEIALTETKRISGDVKSESQIPGDYKSFSRHQIPPNMARVIRRIQEIGIQLRQRKKCDA